ncbi:substrate-binding domain-containing protein [Rhodoferax sp.]|uniref:helix-turn-helix transcriptional regulator n=1 Tax=Rhodoferax sp. TaxID=50421 RepID=UPI002731231D|nr:substrate-binding domain-containing protein [Rhodoferax sp.]MDP1531141.1 substrate-binding domain-containing protein [Rhodoferax sp.]MDP1942191.1 substrate-binding domain-containing protein [Rhodoferax sp.]MDP2441220.1 substrate-binding domain-containing protein [Rhodoferax sp.]MDZ4207877.1 substrate-binding domain-containing protein [Rhodoferax sp.]
MHRLQLNYTLSKDSSPALVRNPLIDLLQAVSTQGSISGGARALGLSYRHVWGELKRWENELGNELVIWEKGQSALLTEFGNKLMWAERQAQARLAPQIEALRAELERSYALAFDDSVHVVTLYASHDDALSALREHALQGIALKLEHEPVRLHLDIRFTGSVDAIRALNEGRCVMAGFHTLQGLGKKTLTERTYKPLLQPGQHKIIGFAQRTQGLMVTRGNPLGLNRLQDVVRHRARFANRTLGSGTRVVLDELLTQSGLLASEMNGYGRTEPSHAAVAQAVAAGQCDAGLGIAAAAQQAGLDFVPLALERYHLVCLKSALTQPGILALLQLLQTRAWQDKMAAIPGYTAQDSGQVLSMRKVLPWWDYRYHKVQA